MGAKTLIELGKSPDAVQRYGQDKFGHHYAEVYDLIFKRFQDKPVNLLEIGYFVGGSIRLWFDYFDKPNIRCIDINAKLADPLYPHYRENDDTFRLDIMDAATLTADYFKDWEPDIVIDDGSHKLEDQIHVIKTVYPILKKGAYLIIEDVFDIANNKKEFDKLDIPYILADMNSPSRPNDDSVLLIFKGGETNT